MDKVTKDIIKGIEKYGYTVEWKNREVIIKGNKNEESMTINDGGISSNIYRMNHDLFMLIYRLRNAWIDRDIHKS